LIQHYKFGINSDNGLPWLVQLDNETGERIALYGSNNDSCLSEKIGSTDHLCVIRRFNEDEIEFSEIFRGMHSGDENYNINRKTGIIQLRSRGTNRDGKCGKVDKVEPPPKEKSLF